jgi:hypothetical protein
MLFPEADYCYIFVYDTLEDGPSFGDSQEDSLSKAQERCRAWYGISEWTEIPEPMEGCQHDWIAPVRVKGRERGNPQWGHFEKLVNGQWTDLTVEK